MGTTNQTGGPENAVAQKPASPSPSLADRKLELEIKKLGLEAKRIRRDLGRSEEGMGLGAALRAFGLRPPDVASILVGGIDFSDPNLDSKTRQRNLAALKVLDTEVPGLCEKHLEAGQLLLLLQEGLDRKKEDYTRHLDLMSSSVKFLCASGELLTAESCGRRHEWKDRLDEGLRRLLDVSEDCFPPSRTTH